MSKGGSMGTKRIGSMTSKGMGKCEPDSRAEQCGSGRGLGKGKFEGMTAPSGINPFMPNKPFIPHADELKLLKKHAEELEAELKKLQSKISKLSDG